MTDPKVTPPISARDVTMPDDESIQTAIRWIDDHSHIFLLDSGNANEDAFNLAASHAAYAAYVAAPLEAKNTALKARVKALTEGRNLLNHVLTGRSSFERDV